MDKQILRLIADNQNLFDTLKEHFESYFPLEINDTMTNETLGERTRFYLTAKKALERAFIDIARLKTPKDSATGQNPAR